MATILVVDDSTTDRQLIAAALDGHVIVEATDGTEAIEKYSRVKPDLVVMDVVMPGKNGFEACREIRRMPGGDKAPIIMLTSKNQPTDREWGMRQGATDYLTKPFTDEELMQAVRKHL